MSTHVISVEQFVRAPLEQAYRAFTNATALKEWMADVATLDAHVGGRMYLWWNGDFYSCGEFTAVDPNRALSFTWRGRFEPEATSVRVTFTAQDDGVLVSLAHTVANESVIETYQKEWSGSLKNLASVLETGQDLRITQRPMMGITLGDFTPEQATHLGVPVTEGIRLDGAIAGMGAEQAGLQQNDVLVGLAGSELTSFNHLALALSGKHAGDVVEVVFYRGPEKRSVQMKLSGRPLPEIHFDAAWLAGAVQPVVDADLAALLKAFDGVSEAQAAAKPSADEWSARETLAHLIQSERGVQAFIGEMLNGEERWSDGFGVNQPALIAATLAAHPTLPELLDAFQRAIRETLALLAALPPEFAARKGAFWRLAYNQLLGGSHIRSHIAQIEAALRAAAAG